MSWLERIGLVGLVVYFSFILGLTLGGIPIDESAIDPSEWRRWANLIPFATVGPQIEAGSESGLRELVGNLILMPLGFGGRHQQGDLHRPDRRHRRPARGRSILKRRRR